MSHLSLCGCRSYIYLTTNQKHDAHIRIIRILIWFSALNINLNNFWSLSHRYVVRSLIWCSSGANLDDVPVLNHCPKQLLVFRVVLLLLQVGGVLGSNG